MHRTTAAHLIEIAIGQKRRDDVDENGNKRDSALECQSKSVCFAQKLLVLVDVADSMNESPIANITTNDSYYIIKMKMYKTMQLVSMKKLCETNATTTLHLDIVLRKFII